MNKKSVVSAFALAASSLLTPAYAANDGHLDGYWFSARINTSIPTAINWTNPQPETAGKIVKNVKVDSGKDTCFVALAWGGKDTYSYLMLPVCKNAAGAWELSEFLENSTLKELNDGISIGLDYASLYLAQKDKPFHGFPAGYAYTGYQGTIVITPKLRKGNIINITATTNSGGIYSYDQGTKTGGTSRSGSLLMRLVDQADVPAAAKCAVGITSFCPPK